MHFDMTSGFKALEGAAIKAASGVCVGSVKAANSRGRNYPLMKSWIYWLQATAAPKELLNLFLRGPTRQRLSLLQSPARHIHQPPHSALLPTSQTSHSHRAGQPGIRVQQHDDFRAVFDQAGGYVARTAATSFVKVLQSRRRADGGEPDDGYGEVGDLQGGCEGLVVGWGLTDGGDDNDGGERHCV